MIEYKNDEIVFVVLVDSWIRFDRWFKKIKKVDLSEKLKEFRKWIVLWDFRNEFRCFRVNTILWMKYSICRDFKDW